MSILSFLRQCIKGKKMPYYHYDYITNLAINLARGINFKTKVVLALAPHLSDLIILIYLQNSSNINFCEQTVIDALTTSLTSSLCDMLSYICRHGALKVR